METSGRKKSPAWDTFSIAEDPNVAGCKACNKKVGGKNLKANVRDYESGAGFEGQAHSTTQRIHQKVEAQNAATSLSCPAPFRQILLGECGDHVANL